MKKLSLLAVTVLTCISFSLALSGCDKGPGDQASCPTFPSSQAKKPAAETKIKGRIGMTCMAMSNPFFKLIGTVMQEEAGKHGYEVVCLGCENNAATQNNQITDFVAQKCAAIFLNPADSKGAGEGVKKAHAAGIPVFTFDVQVTDEEAVKLIVSHIGSDNYQGGRLAGKSMMEVTKDQGKIAVISYPEVTSCILRVDGFKDELKEKKSKLQIVAELSGKGDRAVGNKVAKDILNQHGDLTAIFAINDPSALGAYEALVELGRKDKVTIIGFDASPAGKQAVFDKKLYDTPQQFPRKMAKGTVEAFVKYLKGEKVEKKILIPCAHYKHATSVKDESRIKEQW
jgi:ribose transport system substrate-binding protein